VQAWKSDVKLTDNCILKADFVKYSIPYIFIVEKMIKDQNESYLTILSKNEKKRIIIRLINNPNLQNTNDNNTRV